MQVWKILVRYGGWRLLLSTLSGLIGGAALAALMRLVHRALTLPAAELGAAVIQFAALIVAYFVGTALSEHALNDTAERLQRELRQNILRQLVATPLRRLESFGVPRLFGILGGHVKTVADYVCWLPNAVVNLAIVAGCFGYMAWLSPAVFGFNVAFLGLAAACYVVPQRTAQRIGRAASAVWDRHVGQMHFSLLSSVWPLPVTSSRNAPPNASAGQPAQSGIGTWGRCIFRCSPRACFCSAEPNGSISSPITFAPRVRRCACSTAAIV